VPWSATAEVSLSRTELDINILNRIQKRHHLLSFVNFDLFVKMSEVDYSYPSIDRDSFVIDSKYT
jgi:hypothetical protein